MKKIIILIVVLSMQIFAQVKGGVGLGLKKTNSVYDKVNNQSTLIPVIYLTNEKYYIQGTKFGKHLYYTKRFKINAGINIDSNSIYRDENNAFSKINKRVNANIHIINKNKKFNYLLDFNADISNESKGFDFTTQISKSFIFKKLNIEPKIGLKFNDKKTNNYLYGISSNDATLNYPKYSVNSSFEPYLQVDINYRVFKFLGFKSNVRYTQLSNTVKDSPMVKQNNKVEAMFALLFYFKL